ncbi:MAG: penicillin acylase family protein [Alphaproteobacteria bacterium]|nr:penicillin acylase family protein [Alphaproteobacteria bacterium]
MTALAAIARGVGRLLAGVAVFLVTLLVGLYFHLRTSLPDYQATLRVAGPQAAISIVRDRNAVPHIFAGSLEDAVFGLGYVHAQDRLWQMEMMRRAGAGRLSEVIPPLLAGPAVTNMDRTVRALGVYRRAQDSLNALSPRTRKLLEAYSAGVNAHIAAHKGSFGPEFTLLQVEPEPWQPADSLVWSKLMALSLDGNWRAELFRARLAKKLGEARALQLFPQLGDDRDSTLSILGDALLRLPLDRLFDVTDSVLTRKREASNEWVIAGTHSSSGKPLLANDPHLGLSAPGVWYLARLAGPDFDIRGASSPGSPAIVLGHNGRIAWGFATTNLDSQDLFVERVDPVDPGKYLTPDGSRPFGVREEYINVRFGEQLKIRLRTTRHGPVISDVLDPKSVEAPDGHVLALSATALEPADTSAEGFLELGLARNWEQFLAAARKIVSPMQNIVYADTDGNIGFVAPARVPIRRKGDGFLPVPGWSGEYDWAGFVPFEELPRAFNPPSGIVVNANARLVPGSYRHFISREWAEPYRQRRANAMLSGAGQHSVGSMIAIQEDTLSPDAADTLPPLLALEPRDGRERRAMEVLRHWDRRMLADAPGPLIYNAWLRALQRKLYADELGEELFKGFVSPSVGFVVSILRDRPEWCDDVTTARTETCPEMMLAALDMALDELQARYGPAIEGWRWGDAHPAAHRHALFDPVPLLRDVASVRFPADGGMDTLNRAAPSFRDGPEPYAAVHGAGLRAIYDFDDLDNSRFAIPLGESGNFLSPWYANFVPSWRAFEYQRIAGFHFRLQREGVGTVSLLPASK